MFAPRLRRVLLIFLVVFAAWTPDASAESRRSQPTQHQPGAKQKKKPQRRATLKANKRAAKAKPKTARRNSAPKATSQASTKARGSHRTHSYVSGPVPKPGQRPYAPPPSGRPARVAAATASPRPSDRSPMPQSAGTEPSAVAEPTTHSAPEPSAASSPAPETGAQ